MYITHDAVFTEYGDVDYMVAHEPGVPLCGFPASGNPSDPDASTALDSGEREYRVVHRLTEVGSGFGFRD
jgi:hypothetical protein